MKRYAWKRGEENSIAGPCSEPTCLEQHSPHERPLCRSLFTTQERIRVHALWLKRESTCRHGLPKIQCLACDYREAFIREAKRKREASNG